MARDIVRSLAVIGFVLGIAAGADAQSSIAGVVRDASGAVLPGVTVEAASPALIEKTRSVVTDGTGQYRIENLRPGTYGVTLSLDGQTYTRNQYLDPANANWIGTINYEHRWRFDPLTEFRYGVKLMRRVYDGSVENALTLLLALTQRI